MSNTLRHFTPSTGAPAPALSVLRLPALPQTSSPSRHREAAPHLRPSPSRSPAVSHSSSKSSSDTPVTLLPGASSLRTARSSAEAEAYGDVFVFLCSSSTSLWPLQRQGPFLFLSPIEDPLLRAEFHSLVRGIRIRPQFVLTRQDPPPCASRLASADRFPPSDA